MKSVTFEIPSLPPSTNGAVRHGRYGSYPSKALEGWKKLCKARLKKFPIELDPLELVSCEIEYGFKIYTKKGTVRITDLDGRLKYAIDQTIGLLGIDDSRIGMIVTVKVDSPIEYTKVTYRKWEVSLWRKLRFFIGGLLR